MLRSPKTPDGDGETPGMSWAPATGPPHDEESREFLQDRLAFFGKVGALFYMSVALGRSLLLLASPRPEDWGLVPVNRAMLGAGAALGGVWLASRSGRRAAATLLWIDAAGLALAGLAFGSLGYARTPFFDTAYPMVLAAGFTVVARSVMVPSTPGRTLGVSLAASAPVVLALCLLARAKGHAPGFANPGALDVVFQTIWSLVAVGLAVLASRVIYGLRVEAREARQVGQYTLEAKLGEGGMGVVYRARHALLKRPTAVKLLPPEKSGVTAVERFAREVQLTARLTHPNTVAIFDYGRTLDGVFYYAMEYLDGVSLEALVAEDGPQPPARVVHVLMQVCGALAEAHALGLVHRDIKPANIVLGERGGVPDVAKVLDFGLVKETAPAEGLALTHAGAILGTPLYMAPEALTAPDEVGPRSDLYGLGAVGYYLLTGAPVFEGRSAVEVLGHQLHTTPRRPSERLGRELPPQLEDVILDCLAKSPARRPASAKALRDAFASCSDVGPWTEDDARAWWNARTERKAGPFSAGIAPHSLSVDLTRR